jgi:hypothetical protein
MRKWNLPLTYKPKIHPVMVGTIRQTIRTGTKFNEGDLIRFYIWLGKPYRSRRETITDYLKLTWILNIRIYPWGFQYHNSLEQRFEWPLLFIDAEKDGIVPPTGEALRDVLMSKNKIPDEGIEAQIIRW